MTAAELDITQIAGWIRQKQCRGLQAILWLPARTTALWGWLFKLMVQVFVFKQQKAKLQKHGSWAPDIDLSVRDTISPESVVEAIFDPCHWRLEVVLCFLIWGERHKFTNQLYCISLYPCRCHCSGHKLFLCYCALWKLGSSCKHSAGDGSWLSGKVSCFISHGQTGQVILPCLPL